MTKRESRKGGRDNPFYDNRVFSEFDIDRVTIKRWERLWLWILPTYVQVSEGYAFHYKIGLDGAIYLMKEEKL